MDDVKSERRIVVKTFAKSVIIIDYNIEQMDTWCMLMYGVPQGRVQAPVLLFLYIIDLLNLNVSYSLMMFQLLKHLKRR